MGTTQLSFVGKLTVSCEKTGGSAKIVESEQQHRLAASPVSCFSQCVCKPLKLLKPLSASSCSTMSFVFNFYQCGDAVTTPPRPRPKTAARPTPALLPPGDWSEPIRRRRRDDPADAGDRQGRSHSPRHRRRRHSRSPRRRAAPEPRRPKSASPSVPPENLRLLGHFQHRDRLFSKGRKCLCLLKGTNRREPRCLLDSHGLALLAISSAAGASSSSSPSCAETNADTKARTCKRSTACAKQRSSTTSSAENSATAENC